MFLVDKYFKNTDYYDWHQSIIEKILESFNNHTKIYSNMSNIIDKPINEFTNIINNLNCGILRFSNFQHLVVYGKPGSGKEFLVNKLLEKIYNKENTELNEIEYIEGYKTVLFVSWVVIWEFIMFIGRKPVESNWNDSYSIIFPDKSVDDW